MKRIFTFLISACLSGMMAHADTYPYLTFQQADGTQVSVSTSSLTMVFTDGKLIASNGTVSQELTVADLASMYFSTTDATGIKETVISDADGEVEAFTLQGISVGKYTSLQEVKEHVPMGIYILKTSSGKTSKVAIK